MQIIWYIVYEKTQKFSASMVQKPQLLPGVGRLDCSQTRSRDGNHVKRKDERMPSKKTRKSDKRADTSKNLLRGSIGFVARCSDPRLSA